MKSPVAPLLVAASACLALTMTATMASAMGMADPSSLRSTNPTPEIMGGAGVGRFVGDGEEAQEWLCKYDMVLVERLQAPPKTESGLFVPQESLPRLHLARVLSMGSGREEENGRIAPMPDIKIGDVVIAKNPWGIGPKDEEFADGRKLSFMRGQDISAKVTGKLLEEVEA